MRLLSLFSGIGAFEKALDRGGIEYELVNYCEIDKYASRAYAAVHGVSEDLNLRDVQTIDCDQLKGKGVNLITYGFPCQDISVAGKMKGFEHDGQKTRSGLFYDALRVIRELQPEVAIAENVKALTSKKFEGEFVAVREGLAEAGYNNYYAVLDASDYGIPQHRERVFIVSIRKDIDKGTFAFPQKEPLRLRLKDLLENEVEEKYFIDNDRTRELIRKLADEGKLPEDEAQCLRYERTDYAKQIRKEYEAGLTDERRCNLRQYGVRNDGRSNTITTVQKDNYLVEPTIKTLGNLDGHETGRVLNTDGITQSLKGTDYKNPVKVVVKQVGNLIPEAKFNNTQRGRVYDPEGCSPTINTMQGGSLEPKILVAVNDHFDTACKACKAVGDLKVGGERGIVYDAEKSMCTLSATQYKDPHKILYNHQIRKTTPLECWRLMGFDDEDFKKAKNAGISNTQLYKQAGNSICVPVLTAIFRQLYQ